MVIYLNDRDVELIRRHQQRLARGDREHPPSFHGAMSDLLEHGDASLFVEKRGDGK